MGAPQSLSIYGQWSAVQTAIDRVLPGSKGVSDSERDLLAAHLRKAVETLQWLDNSQSEIREALLAHRTGKAAAP